MDFQAASERFDRGRQFGAEHIADSVEARDRDALWNGDLFRRLGDEGILTAHLQPEDGGSGLPASAIVDYFQGLAETSLDPGWIHAVSTHIFGCTLVVSKFGTTNQRRRYLQALGSGEAMGAWAHDEQAGPGDGSIIRTRATKMGQRWIIEGKKTCVVNASIADVFLVTAITDPDRGREGISVFLVDKKTRGCIPEKNLVMSGLRTATFANVTFDRCEVTGDNLLGSRGIFSSAIHAYGQRNALAAAMAPWIGIMRTVLQRCVTKTRSHYEMGRLATQSQRIRARLANMKIELELSSRLQHRAAWLLDHEMEGRDRDLVSARLFMSESLSRFLRDARTLLEISGDPELERLFRDADVFARVAGSADALRTLLGTSLLGLS